MINSVIICFIVIEFGVVNLLVIELCIDGGWYGCDIEGLFCFCEGKIDKLV